MLFLLSPRLPDDQQRALCSENIYLSKRLSFPLCCDYVGFMVLAREPTDLLTPDNTWQSRPMYILSGAALNALLHPLVPDRPYQPGHVPAWRSAYIAFIIVNFVVLWVSVALFVKLLPAGRPLIGLAFAAILIANDVVKVFFWTPHTQMFNVLSPLASAFACRAILTRPQITVRLMASLGLLTGLLSLFYGSFLLLAPAMLVALPLRNRWHGRRLLADLARPAAALLLAVPLPILFWVSVVWIVTGGFHSHEVAAYRQFVWIADTLREGNGAFQRRLVPSLAHFLDLCAGVSAGPLALLAGIVVLLAALRAPLGVILRDSRATLVAVLVSEALSFVFFALLGLYQARLAWNVVPPILVVAATLAETAARRIAPWKSAALSLVVVVTAAIWVAYAVMKPGPYG